MATKKTGILSAIIDSFPAVAEKAPAPAPALASIKKHSVAKKVEKNAAEKEVLALRIGAMKELDLALSSDSVATKHWKQAGVAYSTIYDSKESMSSDEKLKKDVFRLIAEKFSFSDALAKKLTRGDDSPEALIVKKEKSTARATQGTYWSRLLNYSFPPTKGKKTPSHGGADEAGEGDAEAPKGPAKSTFEGLIDGLSTVITGLEALEDAPKGANITQALKHLGIARAHLRGI